MTSEYAFGLPEQQIMKMPAADPEVQRAAKELVTDPDAYFEHHGKRARQQIREVLAQRHARIDEARAEQAQRHRRERLHRLFNWFRSRR